MRRCDVKLNFSANEISLILFLTNKGVRKVIDDGEDLNSREYSPPSLVLKCYQKKLDIITHKGYNTWDFVNIRNGKSRKK